MVRSLPDAKRLINHMFQVAVGAKAEAKIAVAAVKNIQVRLPQLLCLHYIEYILRVLYSAWHHIGIHFNMTIKP